MRETARRWHERTNSPVVPFVVALVLANLFVVALLRRNGYDRSRLVVAGDVFVERDHSPASLFVYPSSAGYDGQFYYRLALAPFTAERTAYGITLDNPAYRQRRILLPVLAWIASFGDPARVPSALIALNLIALAALGWIGGVYAQLLDRHALWGLAIALYPGFLLSTARDCAEVLALALSCGALVLVRRERFGWATCALALATLARESALVVALGLAAAAVYDRVRRRERAMPFWVSAVPVALQIAWQTALSIAWNAQSLDPHRNLTLLPFEGIARLGLTVWSRWNSLHATWLAEFLLVALAAALALVGLRSPTSARFEKLAFAVALALAVFLSPNVWVEDWAFMRACSELYVLAAILALGAGARVRWPLAAGLACVYALVFLDLTLGWR